MRKTRNTIILFLLAMAAGFVFGQTTAVTATVTDSDGFVWTTAKVTVQFIPNPSFPQLNQYTLAGQNLATYQPYNALLNQSTISDPSTGAFSFTLLDNTQIQPAGSNWKFTIQSNTSAQSSTYNPVQVFGASQSLTTFLSTFAVAPRFPAINGAYGYGDIELTTVPNPGGLYFNTTTSTTRQWNGTVWGNLAGGSPGVSSINTYNGPFTFSGSGFAGCTPGATNVCTFSGGTASFNLNVGEMGALSSGANPPLTHTNHYVVPLAQTTAQINAMLALAPTGTYEFQAIDSVANSFTNTNWQAHIIHGQFQFFTNVVNWDNSGVVCNGRRISITFNTASKTITSSGTVMGPIDIGKVIWAWNNVTQQAYETQIQTVADANHFTVATFPPWNQASGELVWIGTDNSTTEQAALNSGSFYSGGYGPAGELTLSAGACMAHTLNPNGATWRGAGILTTLVGAPGEDIFATPDAYTTPTNQGIGTHIDDAAIVVAAGIDATKPWTLINDSGTTAKTALNRPAYIMTKDSNYPLAPEWCIGSGANGGGCIDGVATTNGTTSICVQTSKIPSVTGTPQIIFPYAVGGLIETTVASVGSACTGGTTVVLGTSIPSGTQQEFFAGINIQHTAIDFPANPTYPFLLTMANPIVPTPASEAGLAPYGLFQIGNQQCTYRNINFQTRAFNVTGCTGTSVDHPSTSYVAALNPFQPSVPFPVFPTINSGDTTPSNAAYFPGHNIGNCAFAFPQSNGSANTAVAWTRGHIENLTIEVTELPSYNNTCSFYFVGQPYSTHFNDIRISGTQYGPIQAVPAIENHNWFLNQPTADGTTWTGITISTGYIFDFINGNQNNYSNFDTYSQLNDASGTSLGAAGAFFFTSGWDDQTGSPSSSVSQAEAHNLYIEPENGLYTEQEALNEFDSISTTYTDIHQGGGGYVYVGGSDNHFIGGDFNNAALIGYNPPIVNYGQGNSFLYVELVGSSPNCNNFTFPVTCEFINWGPNTLALVRADISGPYTSPVYGNSRAVIRELTNEGHSMGGPNIVSSEGGMITPEEFGVASFDPLPMNHNLWTFDSTALTTQSNAGCNVPLSGIGCAPKVFNFGQISIAKGQRIVPGKYMAYGSFKSGLATNSFTFQVAALCPGQTILNTFVVPVTSSYPATVAAEQLGVVDFSAYNNCNLQLIYSSATSGADVIYTQLIDFAPLPENFNVQQLSISGTGQPTFNMGANGYETWQTGAPSTGCGSTYPNGSIWHDLAGTAAGVNRFWICDAATTTWNAKF